MAWVNPRTLHEHHWGGRFRTEGPCVCVTAHIISLMDSALGPRQVASRILGRLPAGCLSPPRSLSR